jgi:hypothetical protein
MEEIWKPIVGYEELYEINNYGDVKSLKKICKNNYFRNENKILKLSKNKNGYISVRLNKDGKAHTFNVHRLVAETFIPNPNNYPEVNHKDENKWNNCVENLEWCTRKYNANYGFSSKKAGEKLRKKVVMFDLNNNMLKKFDSLTLAHKETNIPISSISNCCNGRQKKAGDYFWRYVNE